MPVPPAEKRIRLLAFDVPPDTAIEDLELPVSDVWPAGCKIIWAAWHFIGNCLVAGVFHEDFPAQPLFSHYDICAHVDRDSSG